MFAADLGSGDVVLLLHGTPSPAADWQPIAQDLAAVYRVLVPELPGYGRTPQLDHTTVEAVGDALAIMLRERDVANLHAIVGYSTGVYRAFDLVVRHRIEVATIVALAGMVTFDEAARVMRGQFADLIESDPSAIQGAALRETMRTLMLSEGWRREHPADDQRVVDWLALTSPPALVAELRSLALARDLRPELVGFRPPVHARVGELDVGAPPSWSEQIVASVANGRLEIVPGAGHALLVEDLTGTREFILRAVNA